MADNNITMTVEETIEDTLETQDHFDSSFLPPSPADDSVPEPSSPADEPVLEPSQSFLPPYPPVDDSVPEPSTAPSNSPSYNTNDLTNIEITNEIVALNVMVSFLNVAQKRGAFAMNESAKIWECVQKFVEPKK